MAFSSTLNGDIVRLNYVLPEVVSKSIFIPGVTEPSNMVVSGESAYWKEFTGADATDGAYGRNLSITNAGFKRYSVDLSKSIALCNLVDGASVRANEESAVEVAAREMAAKATKKHNALGLAAMVTGGTTFGTTTAETTATIFGDIVDAVAKYEEDNKAYGDVPTAVIISPTIKALLVKALGEKAFQSGSTNILFEGYLGRLAGVDVLESLDLPTKTEFVVLGKNSFLAPYDVNDIQIIRDVPGYVGAEQLQSEMPYGFAVTKASRVLVKKSA